MTASILVLPAIISVIALVLVAAGIYASYQIRSARLPDATKYEHVRELRAQEEALLSERRAELSLVEQKIQQRDRLIAEVASIEERRNAIHAELASLDSARTEIEQVKADAAAAAAELATRSQELKEKEAELARLGEELDPARISSLKKELAELTNEQKALTDALPALRAERDGALQRIEEANAFGARKAALEVELERIAAELATLEKQRAELRELEATVNSARQEASRLSDETQRETVRRGALLTEIEEIARRHSEAKAGLELLKKQEDRIHELKAEAALQRTKLNEIQEDIERLTLRKAKLEEEAGVAGPEDQKGLSEDLLKFPFCLNAPATLRRSPRTESEALHTVSTYLTSHGLTFSPRTIRSLHTSLKINDNAQLTVLAGVSGTGKSLLPRRYAEAMGIHFLQIAVEPRWDSPQDLLGFYNYIEKKYRATDLARLLVHLDPYQTVQTNAESPDRHDHMAIVLLDEMNLARVEYYFSEFLSRLEVRPRFNDSSDEAKRADARIPVDIRGLKTSISLYPAHNVLFAGTMNDDESTQSLSDKVLDRGNIIQFAAPSEFATPKSAQTSSTPLEAQSFTSWRTWIKGANTIRDELPNKIIGQLAGIMEECGRPFGHRLRDAILAYVASYPQFENHSDVRIALADQIEFRILPKLRGLEIETYPSALDNLERLIRDDLGDAVFADRFGELRARQSKGTGLLVWRGLTREG